MVSLWDADPHGLLHPVGTLGDLPWEYLRDILRGIPPVDPPGTDPHPPGDPGGDPLGGSRGEIPLGIPGEYTPGDPPGDPPPLAIPNPCQISSSSESPMRSFGRGDPPGNSLALAALWVSSHGIPRGSMVLPWGSTEFYKVL